MKKIILSILFLSVFSFTSHAQVFGSYDDSPQGDTYYEDYIHNYTHKIQIALILDVSGSMDGLIDQAKSQLWTVVNSIMFDESLEGYPQIEIALLEYGNSRNHRDGYMRIMVPFTSNLDWVADELFSLRTGGNREYGPQAVDMAINRLQWTRSGRDLRLLYIAGNESFHQGYTDYRNVAHQARRQDIIVNTIFCGDYHYGQRMGWNDAARLGNGDYLNIEQNYRPYYDDDQSYSTRLYSLNEQLNGTYIPFGRRGNECFVRQRDLDRRAGRYGRGYASQRYITKSTGAYMNPDWDLVDAVATGRIKLDEVRTEDLPPEMRGMSRAERRNFVQQKLRKRQQVQSEMRGLGVQQIKRVENKLKEQSKNGSVGRPSSAKAPQSLDQAIIKSTRHQQEVKHNKGSFNKPKLETPSSRSNTNRHYQKPDLHKPQRNFRQPTREEKVVRPSSSSTRSVKKYPSTQTQRNTKSSTPVRRNTSVKKSAPSKSSTSVKRSTPVRTQPKPARVQQSSRPKVTPSRTTKSVNSNSSVKKSPTRSSNTKKASSPSKSVQNMKKDLRRRN